MSLVPFPPQPTRPTLISSLPPSNALDFLGKEVAVTAAAAVDVLMKLLRVFSFVGLFIIFIVNVFIFLFIRELILPQN